MSFVKNAWYVAGWSTDFGQALTPLTASASATPFNAAITA